MMELLKDLLLAAATALIVGLQYEYYRRNYRC